MAQHAAETIDPTRTATPGTVTADSSAAAGAPAARPSRTEDPTWWQRAVFYQVYPRSFNDSDGNGVGDLRGVTERMDYLATLGIDALWLSPFYRSPMADHGYDVADPCDVDPVFGTLADFDEMVAAAHARGIKVTVDIVPNHFSDQHEWFQQALAAAPGSPERARFWFRDGRGPNGDEPPNNWPAAFGGPAWHRVPDGQWYLHLFAPEQPDLNWENPEVTAEFQRIIRFWMDRGADGFRVDVAHGLAKPDDLPDMPNVNLEEIRHTDQDIRVDRPRVHDHLRALRTTIDEYPGAMAVGEVWVHSTEQLSLYVRPDELHLSFNFELVLADWDAGSFRTAIETSLASMAAVGATCTWVLGNHDVDRPVTRYSGGSVGVARARAAALVELALPGAAFVYNGEELGLANVALPDSALQDPTWERSGHTERGRDGERVPLPWSGTSAPYGFTDGTDEPWLPMPDDWAGLTVEAQLDDPDSTLSLYRRLLEFRRATPDLASGPVAWVGAPDGCLAFRRGADVLVITNFGDQPAELPSGDLLLASGPLSDGLLPPNTSVYLRVAA